jgi:putative ABC transport system permease protein
MGAFTQDLRSAFRQLRKNAGFTAVALITLALGIGANTVVYSVVHAVLLHPLPYKDSDRLVLIWSTDARTGTVRDQLSFTDSEEYRTRNHTLDGVVAFGDWNAVFTEPGEPERIPGMQVADGYFSLMGIAPLLGRAFLPEEQIEGKDQVVILGYGLWQRRFGQDPAIIGKKIILSARPYTVVGVLPKDVPFLPSTLVDGPAQFYRPAAEKYDQNQILSRHLRAIARLKPGVALREAQADLGVINRNLATQSPNGYATTGVRVVSLQEDISGSLRLPLWLMLGAAGFLLLIACANIANLMLARSAGRRREIAVRAALGAGRAQLVRLALTESILLALAGGVCALLLAQWGVRLVGTLGARVIPQLVSVKIDAPVLVISLFVTLASGMLFGLFPALQQSCLPLNEELKEGGRGTAGTSHGNFRKGLAISEISLALMLLAGTGLMLRTFLKVEHAESGFNGKNLLTMGIGLPSLTYPFGDLKTVSFYRELIAGLKALPGIQGAAAVSILPLGGDFDTVGTEVEGTVYAPGEEPYPERYFVTPDYFKVMQISLLRGRFLAESDNETAPLVALVSATAARQWWPNEDPVGKRIRLPGFVPQMAKTWRTVVGVVHDVKQAGLDAPRTMQIYIPQAQARNGSMTVVVRTLSDPSNAISELRSQVSAIDNNLAVSDIAPMEDVESASIDGRRFTTILMGVFGGLGLTLAIVGVYGILSYMVAQRTAEMGIRSALGASRADLLTLVVRQGAQLAAIGMLCGIVGSLLLTRLLSRLLFEISPFDPTTFVGVVLLMSSVSMIAIYIPARRASKVDPMVALRYE